MPQEYLIALGSNLGSQVGDPNATLAAAFASLRDAGLTPIRISRFFATPCFPAGQGPDYVNACSALRPLKSLTEYEILQKLHEIEAKFGRARIQRWGSRTLDLDLIAAGDRVLPDAVTHATWRDLPPADQRTAAPDQLILPHPRMHERAFVLVPLRDVAPQWQHPILRQTVAQLCDALPAADRAEVVPITARTT